MYNLPSISVIIPTYNEEKNIERCLSAIFNQDYPKKLLEVIVIDNYSRDNTLELIKRHEVKVFFNKIRDAEVSKMRGLHRATKDLFLYLDADIELVGIDWLKKIVIPFVENPNLMGSFPRFIPKKSDCAIGRFLRYHPLELDPLLQFFCAEIKDTVIREKRGYKICEFHPPSTPPIGICLYKRDILLKLIGHMEKFMDIDVPVILSKNGFNRFAYVSQCGIYHTNVRNINGLIQKRLRNINQIYLPNIKTRQFAYFPSEYGLKNLIRIALCVLYANSFMPPFIKSCYRMFKYKDIALLYETIVAFFLFHAIIYNLLCSKEGRRFIRKRLLGFLK